MRLSKGLIWLGLDKLSIFCLVFVCLCFVVFGCFGANKFRFVAFNPVVNYIRKLQSKFSLIFPASSSRLNILYILYLQKLNSQIQTDSTQVTVYSHNQELPNARTKFTWPGLHRTRFQTYKWVTKVYLQVNCMEIWMGFPILKLLLIAFISRIAIFARWAPMLPLNLHLVHRSAWGMEQGGCRATGILPPWVCPLPLVLGSPALATEGSFVGRWKECSVRARV